MITTQSGIVTKFLVPVPSMPGVAAEVSLIERDTKNIVCFSTQIGCAIKCKFCASGQSEGPVRNLTADDMYYLIEKALFEAKESFKPTVISAMGEGEPAQNYKAVGEVLTDFAKQRFKTAVSTSGPSRSLLHRLLSAVPDSTKIQYSLHSATEKRREIIPGPTLDPKDALDILSPWPNIELNVVLWQDINTDVSEIQALAHLLRKTPSHEPWRIKLNRANPIEGGLTPASPETYQRWAELVRGFGFSVEYYETDGSDINAACGQLRAKHVTEYP
jgi:23S rRNA (adenine2503-C2)-methyltransferase